mmetsp:Transcript_94456/g.225052  ORF Transcript_94456/g.225052 Transcript_94456/m.225052 type:complete len:267 (+) Transcript_94456:922-1722(+)
MPASAPLITGSARRAAVQAAVATARHMTPKVTEKKPYSRSAAAVAWKARAASSQLSLVSCVLLPPRAPLTARRTAFTTSRDTPSVWGKTASGPRVFLAISHSGPTTLSMKKSVRRILFIDQRTSIAISMGDDRMGQPTCTKKFRINCSRISVQLVAAPVETPVAVSAIMSGWPAPTTRLAKMISKRFCQAVRSREPASWCTRTWICPVPSTCTARRRSRPSTPIALPGHLPFTAPKVLVPVCRQLPSSRSARYVWWISLRTFFTET